MNKEKFIEWIEREIEEWEKRYQKEVKDEGDMLYGEGGVDALYRVLEYIDGKD